MIKMDEIEEKQPIALIDLIRGFADLIESYQAILSRNYVLEDALKKLNEELEKSHDETLS